MMRQILQSERRSRGRPQIRSDEETRHLIVEAAAQVFQTSGYAGACMGDVAQAAGVSTKTLYRLIPTKAELFISVITARIGLFMLAIDDEALAPLGVDAALEHILTAYGTLTLDARTIAINRLVLAESDRFPEIGAAFYQRAIMRTSDAFETWLRRQVERGLIRLDDPHAAVGMLRGMMIMEPHRAVMLGQHAPPDAAEIASRAKLCTRLFLDGCRAQR